MFHGIQQTTVNSKFRTQIQRMLDLHQSINSYMQNHNIKYHNWNGSIVEDIHLIHDKFKCTKGS